MEFNTTLTIAACIIGFMLTWSVGANDLANIMSTTMGSKAVRVSIAIGIAIIFEFLGAYWGGTHVTNTIRGGIINAATLTHSPELLVYAMLSALIAGTTWMLLASYLSLPVSVTNATVGALIGFGALIFGPDSIHWSKVGQIATAWILSPAIAGVIAYVLFMNIRSQVLNKYNPFAAAKRMMPLYLLFVGVILSIMLSLKGLEHFGYQLNGLQKIEVTAISSLFVIMLGLLISRVAVECPGSGDMHHQFNQTEKLFGILMGITACAMVFAHGSNDVAIAVGPIAAIVTIAQSHGHVLDSPTFPAWITLMGVTGVVLGLIMYGRKIIATVGSGITALTPSRAFAATLAAAGTVILSTSTGIPVSATQTLVGAVLGVGMARGISALNITVIRNILISWVITIPVSATFAIGAYYLLHAILGS